jgi:3-dehydroquinate dehydratase / shikimate dehydrogenase
MPLPPDSLSTRLICPLTAAGVLQMRRDAFEAARAGADAVELRLDYLRTPPDEEHLRALIVDSPLDVIVTCRPQRQGGRFQGSEEQRLAILRSAGALHPAFADVEMDVPRDLWPPCPVLLSHHDFQGCPADLEALAERLDASGAAACKLAFAARGPEDALRALDVLRAARKPTIALAMGEAGVLSRILARKFGAFGTYAALSRGAESAPGQPTLDEFRELYHWHRLGSGTEVYGVIGHPVAHSLSPLIHNRAMSAAGLDAVYLPLLIEPGEAPFRRFLDALLQRPWLGWRGLSVTIPHKENALRYVGAELCEELARKIGAVNTISIAPGGGLRGDNTDYASALDALCQAMKIERSAMAGRRVAVLGAGGAARAIVAGLRHYGAGVVIYNRTLPRAEALGAEFGARAAPAEAIDGAAEEILINCTPVGMHPKVEDCPIASLPPSVRVVFDTIYNPLETLLLRGARKAGCLTVSGLEMFVGQAVAQFQIWTGKKAPASLMREVVRKELEARSVPGSLK